ncbi:MAG: HAD-IIIA family hydrolase [Kiritimatiellae bacterium]|nr:HAD-IIIA family hydrolase [Kiritimatiellia bacterium]
MCEDGGGSKPAFFLDRDDTLVPDAGYMSRPEQLSLLGGVREALLAAKAAGWRLYLLTNQSGIGRGYYTMADAVVCNGRLEELLGLRFDGICIAPEKPGEPSRYRKPSPAFVLERIAADGLDPERCVVVGDKTSDIECGLAAGVAAALVARGSTRALRPDAAAFAASHGVEAFPSAAAAVAAFVGKRDDLRGAVRPD